MLGIQKYPRTRHLEGSRLQPGDEDLAQIPMSAVRERHIVIEEKVDGANCAISFSGDAALMLQSRGHYLLGGPRERHFDLFKRWARTHVERLFDAIGDRYIVYGEWLYAKHTLFYDALPHYFMEFDVLDRQTGEFLDTPRRREVLHGLPIVPVKVLFEGILDEGEDLKRFLGPSHFMTAEMQSTLALAADRLGLNVKRVLSETDLTGLMEGLYLKVEEQGVVKERLKFVRADFTMQIIASESHWQSRPIVPNELRPGTDIFSDEWPGEAS